ncbi:MAG TPA: DUF1996 domain-containing protein [Thermoleophilaceae bacterium]|nr:DUF1996 domain-containing protein [Thermoleophilaceae bacterium]
MDVVARRARALALAGMIAAALGAAPAAEAATFKLTCARSHSLEDDPIVSPGKPGAAHLHEFLGNTSTNAFSTHASLRAAPGRCRVYGDTEADRSAYWIPALEQRNQLLLGFTQIKPSSSVLYYVTNHRPATDVRAFPAGLKLIAGDAHAAVPQPTSIVKWHCYYGTPVGGGTRPHCDDNDDTDGRTPGLRLELNFPSCWDGVRLDSPDHKSHLAYAEDRYTRCPATHPVPVPRIQMFVFYLSPGGPDADVSPLPGAVRLTSGGQLTMHGDFFEAWDPAKLDGFVRNCLHAGLNC